MPMRLYMCVCALQTFILFTLIREHFEHCAMVVATPRFSMLWHYSAMPDNYAVLAVKTIYQNINVWNTTNGDGPKASWNLICLCHKQQSSYFTKNKKKLPTKEQFSVLADEYTQSSEVNIWLLSVAHGLLTLFVFIGCLCLYLSDWCQIGWQTFQLFT